MAEAWLIGVLVLILVLSATALGFGVAAYQKADDNKTGSKVVTDEVDAKNIAIDTGVGVALDIVGSGDARAQMRIRSNNATVPTDIFMGKDPNDEDSGLWSISSRGNDGQGTANSSGELSIYHKPDGQAFGNPAMRIDRNTGKVQTFSGAGYGGLGLASFDDESSLPADAVAGTMLYSSTNSCIYVKTYGGGSATGGDWKKAALAAL